ncbi:hypothetical protein ACFV4N_22750, partial [Actinosynnema sp. NPDC059797]
DNTERLWAELHIKRPTLEDCLDVIGQLARTRRPPKDDDVLVALETLRLLARHVSSATVLPPEVKRRLSKLPLFTSRGWTRQRPVYTTDDPALADGLREKVPVWQPGGEITQFEGLLTALRITRIDTGSVTVATPDSAQHDPDATELFAATSALFQDDLALNDPTAARALASGWSRFHAIEVHVDPDLRVRVEGIDNHRPVEVEVTAKADLDGGRLYLRTSEHLRRVDGAGRAIAGLFTTADHRQLAQAWLAACIAAEEGRTGLRLRLAEQQAAEERALNAQRIADRTAALGKHISNRQTQPKSTRAAIPPRKQHSKPTGGTSTSTPRELVDPSRLTVAQIQGRPCSPARPPRPSNPTLPPPNRTAGPPTDRTSPPGFTAVRKESVGLEIVRLVLNGDADDIADLRAQRGVGADAVDGLDQFYELKVHLGDEPDTITLQDSQVRRALSTPDFFLVVVSNIEGRDARPKVRIIPDPVRQLSVNPSSSVTFSGVRTVEHSLEYNLDALPSDDAHGPP